MANKQRERTDKDARFLKKLGKRIKSIREEQEVSLAATAVAVGLESTQSQTRREKGESDFVVSDLKRYATCFNVTLVDMLEGV